MAKKRQENQRTEDASEGESSPEESELSSQSPQEDKPAEQEKQPEKAAKEKQSAKADKEKQPAQKEPTELEKAQALAEDYKRKWYAVAAEYDNYRKRTATQASNAYAEGKAEAILKLLPVADTFGYALDAAKDEATRAGIDKIIKNFANILATLGVEEVPIAPGDAFDEKVAEAVMNVPCGEGEQPNVVKQVLRKGFRQGGKIIRFAQVSVTC